MDTVSMKFTDKWVDAQQMALDNPETFGAPNRKKLENVFPGAGLKVCNDNERFWIIVKSVKPATSGNDPVFDKVITAEVNNRLVYTRKYNVGDTIVYKARHVYEIIHLCAYCKNKATKTCGKCLKVKYCDNACQKSDWKNHKTICSESDNGV